MARLTSVLERYSRFSWAVIVACARHTYSFAHEPKESTFLPLPDGTWIDRGGNRKFAGDVAIADLLDGGRPIVVLERK